MNILDNLKSLLFCFHTFEHESPASEISREPDTKLAKKNNKKKIGQKSDQKWAKNRIRKWPNTGSEPLVITIME